MSMRKTGSDPKGWVENLDSRKLASLENRGRTKQSVTFGETAPESEIEEHERPKLFEGKEWTPQDAGDHDPRYADGRSEDGDI